MAKGPSWVVAIVLVGLVLGATVAAWPVGIASANTPTISNVQPSGSTSDIPSEMSADIADGGTHDVTVEFIVDGDSAYTETISASASAKTVTADLPVEGQSPGQHNLTVVATDVNGNTETKTETYTVSTAQLAIRNETDDTLIESEVNVTFLGREGHIESKTTSDGSIDISSLPTNQSYFIRGKPSDSDLTTRTTYAEDVSNRQVLYLLDTASVTTIESRFQLEDPTGVYDSAAILKIQRLKTKTGTSQYETIVGDQFGSEGVPATLESDQRYRLRIRQDGTEQIVGPYRATSDETIAVEPGTPSVDLGPDAFEGGWAAAAELRNDTLEYVYSDPDDSTAKLTVWIHERGNVSNQLQANQTFFSIGSASQSISLTANETENEWVVNFVVDRNAEKFTHQVLVGNSEDLTPPVSGQWRAMIGVALLILFAGAFSVLNAGVGAVVVALVGGLLWWIGYLGGIATGAGVAIGIFLAVIAYMYKGAR